MQFAATIHEAASRIEEATAVFRFKARQTTGEFDDLGAHWTDARSTKYNQQFVQPQRDAMEVGELLCRRYAELSATAKSKAQQAEEEITAFFSIADGFESMAVELKRKAEAAIQSSQSAMATSDSVLSECISLGSQISSVAGN